VFSLEGKRWKLENLQEVHRSYSAQGEESQNAGGNAVRESFIQNIFVSARHGGTDL
jgi:hypothetical protein